MDYRTDLAVEQIAFAGIENDGIAQEIRGTHFKITETVITDDRHYGRTGKGRGRYVTLESPDLSRYTEVSEELAEELSAEISGFVPDGDVLVAGLGNNDITPDALGPQTAFRVLATRHLSEELGSEDEFLSSLRKVSVIAGGVLGQTGIESAELIKALCERIKPKSVIVVDALACSDTSRLGTTIQISDSGISPGSGVSNSRKEISRRTLGLPVTAIGVPTVVDMHTIIHGLTGKNAEISMPNMIVTPRDIDRLTERASKLIAFSLNLALHREFSPDDVRELF